MANFDPWEWEHVRVNRDKIEEVAIDLVKMGPLEIADWSGILPQGLETKDKIDYVLGLISIDFCHWGYDENGVCDFYAMDDLGVIVRGSAAMTALAKRTYEQGVPLFHSTFMEKVRVEDLRPYFIGFDKNGHPMEIPWLEDRVNVLNEVGHILREKWRGSFYNLLHKANRRVFNQGKGFIELLVKDFPRFRDEYIYKNKKVGIYKLAQLSVMALQSLLFPFEDGDTLSLCADYQLPRSLRALGILEYSPTLTAYVDQEKLIESGSLLEIELRMATIFAGEQLKRCINAILVEQNKPQVRSHELDYLLWNYGRQLDRNRSKHHLTRTIMY